MGNPEVGSFQGIMEERGALDARRSPRAGSGAAQPPRGQEGQKPGGAAVSSSAQVMDGSKEDLLRCWGCSSDPSRAKWGHEMRLGLQVAVFISGC